MKCNKNMLARKTERKNTHSKTEAERRHDSSGG